MMWFLSGVGNEPTPNVHSDVWDHVESYAIQMLLPRRLKIIPTSNLKLIISVFGITHTITFFPQVVISCCLNTTRSFNFACLLEIGQQA